MTALGRECGAHREEAISGGRCWQHHLLYGILPHRAGGTACVRSSAQCLVCGRCTVNVRGQKPGGGH